MKTEALSFTLEFAFRKALSKLKERKSDAAIVDLFLCLNPESGDFTVLDDEDNSLIKLSVPAWEEIPEGTDTDDLLGEGERALREITLKCMNEGLFEQLNILKPFSVLMVDEEMEVLAELLTLDEEQVLLNEEFVKQMEDELDTFYNNLMADI
jgi:hypothetical protein